jgi:hypothetical protein
VPGQSADDLEAVTAGGCCGRGTRVFGRHGIPL